jgi:hypothetical protein
MQQQAMPKDVSAAAWSSLWAPKVPAFQAFSDSGNIALLFQWFMLCRTQNKIRLSFHGQEHLRNEKGRISDAVQNVGP